jgi:flagellin
MSMVINTNVTAMSSARLLNDSSARLSKSLARLSSGSKIVSPADDAAGLAQSMKFQAQINRNSAANANVGNAISFSQTQDGFLQKVTKALDRMSELSIAAQDVTKTDTDRENYDTEFQQLKAYIDDIANKEFNGVALFSGDDLDVTIDSEGGTFAMIAADLDTDVATDIAGESVGTAADAADATGVITDAIQSLANLRATIGANLQRLNLTSEQISILNENLSAANSRIVDVDVAQESTAFARNNILVQSGTAMLAQANMMPQSALRLLG